jgi:hypothetical protein
MTMIAQEPAALRPALGRFQQVALIVGSVATLLAVAGAFLGAAQFFHSYIFAYFFWFALSLGGLLVLMINHLTQGVWGLMLRRLLEAAAMTLPLMAILFLPIAIETLTGTHYLFPWTNPEVVANDEVVALKTPYLNVPFFLARAVIYFVLFVGMAYLLRQWSLEEDAKGFSDDLRGRFQRLSGPGIVVLVLAWTLAATDWGMSLEPEWFLVDVPGDLYRQHADPDVWRRDYCAGGAQSAQFVAVWHPNRPPARSGQVSVRVRGCLGVCQLLGISDHLVGKCAGTDAVAWASLGRRVGGPGNCDDLRPLPAPVYAPAEPLCQASDRKSDGDCGIYVRN